MPDRFRAISRLIKGASSERGAHGFILLEVLLAMSLIAGSWLTLGNIFQQLVLRLGQLESKKLLMGKSMDQHELSQFGAKQAHRSATSLTPHPKELPHEPSRVSGRPRNSKHSSRTPIKK
jgi:hypothetical protein